MLNIRLPGHTELSTELMTHKGFNISNECAAKRICVVISPGKPGSSQMLPSEVTKTNKIAKTRTLVEHVIQHSAFLDLLQMKFRLICLVI